MNASCGFLARAAIGAIGGLAGTIVLRGAMKAMDKLRPLAAAPVEREPGQFMVEQAERLAPDSVNDRIPEAAEDAAAKMLGLGYGMSFGALYAMLRPHGGSPFTEGMLLGAACWAAGYLGWLPATGLMRPIWRQSAEQVAAPLAEHLLYGAATVAAYDVMRLRNGHRNGLRRGTSSC
jgi:hypothetical protein